MNPRPSVAFSPYVGYSRDEWAALRADTPMPLSEPELENLSGLTERVSTQEVVEIYLPLSRLLNLHVEALQEQLREARPQRTVVDRARSEHASRIVVTGP